MTRQVLIALTVWIAVGGAGLAQEQKACWCTSFGLHGEASDRFGKGQRRRKNFWTDIDSEWSIANPEALKGMESRFVRVRCFVNSESKSIKVLWVKKDSSESS